MTDLLLRGGLVVDGTGAPGRRGDVAITDGKVESVGAPGSGEGARRVVDASDLVVAPGFIDIHTHYDAQALWDPDLSPSSLHGVTSLIGGNCGFSLAPADSGDGEYLLPLLARVEGIPLETLEAAVGWTWSSTDEYLARLEGSLAVNAGFLTGHSTLRRVVMGSAAVGEPADEQQVERMCRLLASSIQAGSLGFSSSNGRNHHDAEGDPVPSRWSDDDEITRLCSVLADHPGTALEYVPSDAAVERERMAAMSVAAQRPLNWNVLVVADNRVEKYESQLAASDLAAERGGRVLALTLPAVMEMRLNFRTAFVFDGFPDWLATMSLPPGSRREALRDPEVRRVLREGAKKLKSAVELVDWPAYVICETRSEENRALAGRTVGEVAAERGADPFDVLLDVVVADDLETVLMPPSVGTNDASWELRASVWRDPRVVLGGSDAGAHLDMLNNFTYPTTLLGEAVRRRGLLGLEEAIHMVTDRPARLYGLRHRGRISPGWAADLVVFDRETVAPGPVRTRADLPAGAKRLYAESLGIQHVIVNGVEIVGGGAFTGARPGALLRSGRDTDTVPV